MLCTAQADCCVQNVAQLERTQENLMEATTVGARPEWWKQEWWTEKILRKQN